MATLTFEAHDGEVAAALDAVTAIDGVSAATIDPGSGGLSGLVVVFDDATIDADALGAAIDGIIHARNVC